MVACAMAVAYEELHVLWLASPPPLQSLQVRLIAVELEIASSLVSMGLRLLLWLRAPYRVHRL